MGEERQAARGETQLSFYLQQQLVEAARRGFLQLTAVIKNAVFYPPAHPFLLGSAEQLLLALEELFAKRNEAVFSIVSGELFFETFSVPVEEGTARVLEDISRRDIGGITFKPGLTRDEIVAFSYLVNRDPKAVTSQGGMGTLMDKAGITHILVQRVLPLAIKTGNSTGGEEKKPSEIFKESVDVVKEIVQAVQSEKTINVRRIQNVVHTMVDSILENRDALLGLTTIKMYDEYTFAHSVNVSILSIAMGAFLSFEKSQVATLGIAGMLHDIGKVNIPREIISKPDSLTSEEWDIVKRHPVEGALILAGMPGVSKLAMVAAFEHHRQHDSRGYPQVGEPASTHPFSSIVAIADAFDALTSVRVYYHIQTPPDEAVRILLGKRGTTFNPVLVKAFVNLVGIFPIGTLVRLNTGEMGLVVHQTRDLLRPRVLILRTFDGTEKEEVSLLEMEGGRYKRSVVDTVDPDEMKIILTNYFR